MNKLALPALTTGFVLCLALALAPISAVAQAPVDRVTFGDDVVVRVGETVHDVVTMGGDAQIEGEVLGDVVTMGGDVAVDDTGVVRGDLVTMGGDVELSAGAHVHGVTVTMMGSNGVSATPHFAGGHHGSAASLGSFLLDALTGLLSFTLLFVLGLVLMGTARERLDALQVSIVRKPFRALGTGVLTLVGAVVAIIALAITIIGIPAAVLVGVALPFAIYVGLAAFASVLGAALPLPALAGKPVLQLGAGVLALYLASLVPFIGQIALTVAAAVGIGALVITRFRTMVEVDREDPTPAGPYRTSSI